MASLTVQEITIRLVLSMIFSGLIGFEREKSNSSAGLRTHILVGMGSTIVALIQIQTLAMVSEINPELKISVDAVRLIAQVVSGIGFLGAGTIIVTKRSVMGLTTAASVWGVSSIGLALGMGYYDISIISSSLMLLVLIFFKRIFVIHGPEQFLIKFIASSDTSKKVTEVVKSFDENYEIVRISTEIYRNELITTHVYRLHSKKIILFTDIAKELSKVKNIVSIESTEIV